MTTCTRREGEMVRLRHSILRLRATLDSLDANMSLAALGGPIGGEVSGALMTIAAEITTQIAKHDAYELVERDVMKEER